MISWARSLTISPAYLKLEPLETPTLLRKVDERYFKRIDAIEYTVGHDDGRGAERLKEADIVLVGLSRTSKTPTAFYLAQEGFKVANVPIVPGIPLPEELFEIDQHKIVCLTIDPEVLQKVRKVRQKNSRLNPSYSDFKKIFDRHGICLGTHSENTGVGRSLIRRINPLRRQRGRSSTMLSEPHHDEYQ